jgi:hypothetical protein
MEVDLLLIKKKRFKNREMATPTEERGGRVAILNQIQVAEQPPLVFSPFLLFFFLMFWKQKKKI